MRSRIICSLLVLVALVAVALPPAAQADAFLRQVRHTDGFQAMGQTVPASTDTTGLWFADNKARMDTGDESSVIVRADTGIVYLLDHEKHTYIEMPIGEKGLLGAMTGGEGEDAEQAEMMQSMMAGMLANIEVTVTPTEERKKIRDWNTRKYVLNIKLPMGATSSEIWASPEIKVDLKLFRTMSDALAGPLAGLEKKMQEMEKIEGMEVYSISTTDMMGAKVKTTTELIEYTSQLAPGGIFDLPAGYSKTSMMESMGDHGR